MRCSAQRDQPALAGCSGQAGGEQLLIEYPLPPKKGRMATETWIPKCPQCGETKLVLAPANQDTHGVLEQVAVYCPACTWLGRLRDHITVVYTRI